MGNFLERFKSGDFNQLIWLIVDAVIITFFYVMFILFSIFLFLPYRWDTLPLVLAITFVVQLSLHYFSGLYRIILRYASIEDMLKIAYVVIPVNIILGTLFRLNGILPFRLLFFGLMVIMQLFTMFVSRASLRIYLLYLLYAKSDTSTMKRTLIIGAGSGAEVVIKEIKRSVIPKNKIVAIIDDDKYKIHRTLSGVKVVDTTHNMLEIIDKLAIEEVIIAIANIPLKTLNHWLNLLTERDVIIKRLPLISEIDGKHPVKLMEVKVEDLLNREPVSLDNQAIESYLSDQIILVTGAGGSIGSELCRQIASFKPRKMVLFDIYENNTYDIQMELSRMYPKMDMPVYIGSVYNEKRLRSVFEEHRPSHVFHAAAYKHVPLMEHSPLEALRTNVIGTYQTSKLAGEYKVNQFVLVSSDKAVRPSNVMGATKRFAELIVQRMQSDYDTTYSAVRFGNVLNSNGSVIPLFQKQIQAGGPVTVTHPEITRFFMTIPEAVSLILQASVFATKGDIFILDMGQPVKIRDLAEKIIRLSGLKPHEDIEIKYIGLRPGEKLYEELLIDDKEDIIKTANELIFIEKNHTVERLKDFSFIEALDNLDEMSHQNVYDFISQYINSYQTKR